MTGNNRPLKCMAARAACYLFKGQQCMFFCFCAFCGEGVEGESNLWKQLSETVTRKDNIPHLSLLINLNKGLVNICWQIIIFILMFSEYITELCFGILQFSSLPAHLLQ